MPAITIQQTPLQLSPQTAHVHFKGLTRHLRLDTSIAHIHHPNSYRTYELFKTYLDIDIRPAWKFDNFISQETAKHLDSLIRKRGEAVHRIKIRNPNQNPRHLVTADEAKKAIRFITSLVKATDSYLKQQLCPHSN